MKKFRIFSLLFMLVACAFLFTGQNVAEANYCLAYEQPCSSDGACCSKVCCRPYDTRPLCEFHSEMVWNTCA